MMEWIQNKTDGKLKIMEKVSIRRSFLKLTLTSKSLSFLTLTELTHRKRSSKLSPHVMLQ